MSNNGAGLSYDVSSIPQPVSNADVYLRALLVEMRLIRKNLERQTQLLEQSITQATQQTTKVKAGNK